MRGRDVRPGRAEGVSLAGCKAAADKMNRGRSIWLKLRGALLAYRRGRKTAMVVLERRIAEILRRIWSDNTTFQSNDAPNLRSTPGDYAQRRFG